MTKSISAYFESGPPRGERIAPDRPVPASILKPNELLVLGIAEDRPVRVAEIEHDLEHPVSRFGFRARISQRQPVAVQYSLDIPISDFASTLFARPGTIDAAQILRSVFINDRVAFCVIGRRNQPFEDV